MRSADAVLLATFAVLVAGLWAIGLWIPRFEPDPSGAGLPFPEEPAAWTGVAAGATVDGRGAAIAGDAVERGQLHFELPFARPAGAVRLRVSGEVLEGERLASARGVSTLSVLFDDAEGERVGFEHIHMAPSRRRASHVERVIGWPPAATTARVALTSRPGAPALSVREGRAELVVPNPRYRRVRYALAGAVVLWGIAFLVVMRRRGALVPLVGVGLVVGAAAYGATASTQAFAVVGRRAIEWADAVFGLSPQATLALLLKGGHALGFFALAFCLYALREALRVDRVSVSVFVVLFAIATEGMQTHVSGRGASGLDILIDLGGAALALAVSLMWTRRRSASGGASDDVR